MDLKLYALLKSKMKEIPKGEPGFPEKITYINPDFTNINLFANTHTEVVYSDTYEHDCIDLMLHIDKNKDFSPIAPGTMPSASVCFNVPGDSFTVAFYTDSTIIWSGAEPAFTSGYTYFLSFVPIGENKLLGAFSEVPT